MNRRLCVFITAVAVFLTASACGKTPGSSLEEAVSHITAEGIRRHVSVLAHDSLRGRDTDDAGFVGARNYVEAQFRRIGLRPIIGDSHLQPFDLLEVVSDEGSRLTVGSDILTYPEVALTPDWRGDLPTRSAEGIFVGHGLVTGELRGPKGQSVDAASLDGRIVFVLAGAPEGRGDEPEIAMRERAEVELAQRAGAVAVVVLNPNMSDAAWTARTRPRRPVRALADGSTPYPAPAGQVGPSASRSLLERWKSGEVGKTVVEPRHQTRRVTSWNIGGLIPGTDSTAAQEVVVFTAHLDHVGIGAPDSAGDSIYNGTHDNALGVAKVLAAAEALAGLSMKRSVLFLATGAEESGLLGAWHYVNNPVVALARTAAAINHDGGLVGTRTDDVFAWGPEFSTVEEDVDWAATETGLALSRNKSAPFGPSAGLLYRSDHYPFLISGVPVVYLMPGFTVEGDPERGMQAWQEYLATVHHAQADNFDESAPYESPVALTSLSVRLAWRLANADGMPQTHPNAPVRRVRATPNGYFFDDDFDVGFP